MTITCTRFLLFIFIASALCPTLSRGQSAIVSPYSRYGIGETDNQPGVQGFSMGNTGIAIHNDSTTPFFINLKNPAACYYNRITTIEAGVLNNNVIMSSEGQKQSNSNTYFSYFSLAMPVGKHAGLGLGIMPMSNIGYDILTSSPLDSVASNGNVTNIGTINNEYTGSGGINRVFGTLAVSPIKNLSIGINTSFLFGNLTNAQTIVYPDNYTAFDAARVQNVQVKDIYLSAGFMYTINLPANWHVVLGMTYAPATNINVNYRLLTTNNMNGLVYDTIQDSSASGKIRLPEMIGYGLTIKKGDQWTFTFDYSTQNWSQFSFLGEQQNLSNSTQMGFGMQYIPKKNTDVPHTYLQKVHYRLGFSYAQTYLDLNNTPLKDYSVSIGLGLPVGVNVVNMRASVLNIGLQLGQFGTTSNNLLQQQYFKFLVGFTFNDRWFIKRQYE